jgi:aminoglycoside phosphotransferase (APT) family kinase protein
MILLLHLLTPPDRPTDRTNPPTYYERVLFLANSTNNSWLSAVRALGALSSLDPKDLGLENFGSHKPYFPRQIKALSKVTLAQAAVKDIDTGKPVGEIPGWYELIAWYERNLPDERKTGGVRIVHGDYKLDNLIFHPTENRVIGILDWELSTLGSPVTYLSLACMTIGLWADVT